MGKYAVFLVFLVYGCYIHKKPVPVPLPPEPISWKVSHLEAKLISYNYGRGREWVETYPSITMYYPGFDSVLIDFFYFPHQDKFIYTCNYRQNVLGHTDSVYLGPLKFESRDEYILSTELTATNYRLILYSPPYSQSYEWNYRHILFGNFYGTPVREDFMRNNGTVHQSRLKDDHGDDSVYVSWYPDGSLQARKDQDRMDYYFQDGSRLSISDTSIKGVYYLTSATYYYANGHIERQEFYDYKTPVHKWTYYNEKGKLLRTVKKKKLDQIEQEFSLESLPEAAEIDRTPDYLDDQRKIIGDKVYRTLAKHLDSSWNYVKPGSYQFLIKFSYPEDSVVVEGLRYPSDNPEYQKWMDDQIQSSVENAKIRDYWNLKRQQVEATFKISFEITHNPKRTQPQN